MTAFEKKTNWRYSVICTNIPDEGIRGVPGSHHPQFIDVLLSCLIRTEARPVKVRYLPRRLTKMRQAVGACPKYANICETCDSFVTGSEFAPALRNQRPGHASVTWNRKYSPPAGSSRPEMKLTLLVMLD